MVKCYYPLDKLTLNYIDSYPLRYVDFHEFQIALPINKVIIAALSDTDSAAIIFIAI